MSNTATVTWDWVKIFISVCVCALGSVTTVQILKQRSVFLTSESNPLLNAIGHSKSITPAQKRRRSLLLLFLASISFGAVAVFTMHFGKL
jgi:NO-binding membrane sensor protein with MHYT domain